MKALLLSGSLAEKSHTLALLHYLEQVFKVKGVESVMWDLKQRPVPIVLPEFHQDPSQHPDSVVKRLVSEVANADFVVLGSPLYHGSYSGALKNALDNLHGDALKGKWVGLVGNASGVRASHLQFSHLRHVVNAMGGYTAQTQVGTAREDYEDAGNAYVLSHEDLKKRCERLVDELLATN